MHDQQLHTYLCVFVFSILWKKHQMKRPQLKDLCENATHSCHMYVEHRVYHVKICAKIIFKICNWKIWNFLSYFCFIVCLNHPKIGHISSPNYPSVPFQMAPNRGECQNLPRWLKMLYCSCCWWCCCCWCFCSWRHFFPSRGNYMPLQSSLCNKHRCSVVRFLQFNNTES